MNQVIEGCDEYIHLMIFEDNQVNDAIDKSSHQGIKSKTRIEILISNLTSILRSALSHRLTSFYNDLNLIR